MPELGQERVISGHRDGVFRALADPTRRRMLTLLAERALPLRRIEEQFRMTRAAVIKHLRVLKVCRLVRAHRDGRQMIHQLNPLPLRAVKNWVSQFEMLWEDRLLRLKHQIESEK